VIGTLNEGSNIGEMKLEKCSVANISKLD